MISNCPKCHAANELDHTQIPEGGVVTSCTSCSSHIQLVRESFARMAYYKAEQKSCSQCGNHLGTTLHCPACHVFYPDFLVVVDSSVVKKQSRDRNIQYLKSAFTGFKISLPNFKAAGVDKRSSIPNILKSGKDSQSSKLGLSRGIIITLICLLVITASVAVGYSVYTRHKAEQVYLETFFKALYGIKSGADQDNKVCAKFVKELTSAQSSGLRVTARATSDEEIRLNKVKTEIDKLMQQLNPPPEKFAKPYENLGKLNQHYVKLNLLAISPPTSLAALNDAIIQQNDAFSRQSQELKSSLTEEMAIELKNAKQRYRILSDF